MNPYFTLTTEYARLFREGKSYQLGKFPKKNQTSVKENAPVVLVFAPHPDDEVIIGGLAWRLLRQSHWRIINVAVTLGSKLERRQGRLSELQGCCDYIGFELVQPTPSGLNNINFAGRQDDPTLWTASVETIKQILLTYNPSVIMFPHDADWNATHIGTHYLVADALNSMPETFSCYTVETEFWGEMKSPNLMVELSEEDLAELLTALSFHVGELERNPYHLSMPAWMIDNVRRGSEVLWTKGAPAVDFTFATLYRLRQWKNGEFAEVLTSSQAVALAQDPSQLFPLPR